MALCLDDRIFGIHDHAVRLAMAELEKLAATRVRKAGAQADRETGNVIGAAFRHDTCRQLDPHPRAHCMALNATFEPMETGGRRSKFKACMPRKVRGKLILP